MKRAFSFACLICLTVILVLSFSSLVQGQEILLEITNRGDPSDYPALAESEIYICTVRWHARALPDADLRFMVSLLNAETKTMLQAYNYTIPAGTEQFGATTFQINVPIEYQGIFSWRLEVTLTPMFYIIAFFTTTTTTTTRVEEPSDTRRYGWAVNTTPIPEFLTTMIGLVLFLSVFICFVFSRKHQTMRT